MLKLSFLTITGCSFWNIFFPPMGGLGPKGCVGHTPMIKEDISLDIMNDLCFDTYANLDFVFVL